MRSQKTQREQLERQSSSALRRTLDKSLISWRTLFIQTRRFVSACVQQPGALSRGAVAVLVVQPHVQRGRSAAICLAEKLQQQDREGLHVFEEEFSVSKRECSVELQQHLLVRREFRPVDHCRFSSVN